MSEHIVSRKIYFNVFGALMVLTVLTVVAANFDFGRMNDVIAMAIAVTKATLVVLFFMHVRYSSRLTWVVVVSGFFWLAIMFLFTLSDYVTRKESIILSR
ncbi:MAG: cytochrome C oxidase subunit IV family protein [Pyrinomonadaceae bacterium]